jgi:bleomycin hydrolase
MKTLFIFISFLIILSRFSIVYAQNKSVFEESKNEFYEQIKSELNDYNSAQKESKKKFRMDFSEMDLPQRTDEFTSSWHQPPLSQGRTGSCWAFSTTSYLESEIYRQYQKSIKLSEIYTVYWEYVEKARRFVKLRGHSRFSEGSLANAAIRVWKKYGVVPAEDYPGLKDGQPFHDHKKLFQEMESYLNTIKETNYWNESAVLANIKSILNHHLGEPPLKISFKERTITPLEYLDEVININLDEYIDFISLKEAPYFKKVEYPVPDNWWHNEEYYNIPLDLFLKALRESIQQGYTVNIGGDVSEAGYDANYEVAMIPSFDIPAKYIDEDARQFRFSNHSTTDDHGIHVVGYKKHKGNYWFLIKDSGSGAFNGPNKGYRFYHEDYVKLKIMNLMIHQDIAEKILRQNENYE